MAIERKIKSSLETELAHARETMHALQSNASEIKRNALKEKLATTKNIMGARSQWAAIKDANAKIPVLEAENKELRALVSRLEGEALEHNRLLNSLRFSGHGAHSPTHSLANLNAPRTPGGSGGSAFDFNLATRNRGESLEAQIMESIHVIKPAGTGAAAPAPINTSNPSLPVNPQSAAIDIAAQAAEIARLEKRIAMLTAESKAQAIELKLSQDRALRGSEEKHELTTQLETAQSTLASAQREIESLKAKLAAEQLLRYVSSGDDASDDSSDDGLAD